VKVTGQHQAPAALPPGTEVPSEYEAGYLQQPVCTFWRRAKSHVPAGIGTPDRPSCNLVRIPTTQFLPYYIPIMSVQTREFLER